MAGGREAHRMDSQPVRRWRHWINPSMIASFLFGALLFSIPVVMLFDRGPVVLNSGFRIDPPLLRRGQKFTTNWTITTLRAGCDGVTSREIIASDGQLFVFDSTETIPHNVVGAVDPQHANWEMPLGIAFGPFKIRWTTKRWCNGLQRLFWPMKSVRYAEATVVPP
jgi:hypothetical protein